MAPVDQTVTEPGLSPLADDERTLMQRYSSLGFSGEQFSQALRPVPEIAEAIRIDGDEVSHADEELEGPTRVAADLSNLSLALDVQERVGRGGMADVRAATQKALRRSVALNSLRADQVTPENARQLLQEARIQGALEHPAVLPVYMLASDGGGNPVIVMRHINGKLWRDYVDEHGNRKIPEGIRRDPLEYHVGVLMQVCSAVHVAHQRGVLHRDLKLRNVMIGSLGEPYLIDWGLACSLEPESDLDLPWVRSEEKLRGTPGYMSPEMAAVEPEKMGPRTDVYLLGGCLHAVLTGWPRHGGRTVIEQLASAYSSRPVDFPPHVPPGLAAIVNIATARAPEDRYATAADMANDLERFLHKHSPVFTANTVTKWTKQVLGDANAIADEEDVEDMSDRDKRAVTQGFSKDQLLGSLDDFSDENSIIFQANEFHARSRAEARENAERDPDQETGVVTTGHINDLDEFDEELSDFRADELVTFFLRRLGPAVYNQAISDARGYMLERLDDLDVEFREPEEE